jgi:hypothetical protein
MSLLHACKHCCLTAGERWCMYGCNSCSSSWLSRVAGSKICLLCCVSQSRAAAAAFLLVRREAAQASDRRRCYTPPGVILAVAAVYASGAAGSPLRLLKHQGNTSQVTFTPFVSVGCL